MTRTPPTLTGVNFFGTAGYTYGKQIKGSHAGVAVTAARASASYGPFWPKVRSAKSWPMYQSIWR